MTNLKDKVREELAQTEEFARGAKESAKRQPWYLWAAAGAVVLFFLGLIFFGG